MIISFIMFGATYIGRVSVDESETFADTVRNLVKQDIVAVERAFILAPSQQGLNFIPAVFNDSMSAVICVNPREVAWATPATNLVDAWLQHTSGIQLAGAANVTPMRR